MAKKYLVGVDLGTSATKAALYSTDGSLVAECTVDVPIHYPEPAVVEQENEDFYNNDLLFNMNTLKDYEYVKKNLEKIE